MNQQKILIIDHQENLLDFYQTWLGPIGLDIHFLTQSAEAKKLIETETFYLILLDLSHPDMDSLELLETFKKVCPQTSIIISFDPTMITTAQLTTALNLGVVAVIEKPYQPEAFLESVQRTRAQHPTGLIYGNLRDLTLPNLVSLLCNEGKVGCLEIQNQGHVAQIFFEKGQIVHAVLADVSGKEVFFEALTWAEGSFVVYLGIQALEQTIQTSWSGLLLEGLNRLDETAFDQEQLEPQQNELLNFAFDVETDFPMMRQPNSSIMLNLETQLQVKDRLNQLHQAANGRCTLLVNCNGRLFHAQGQISENRALALAALVASSFSANNEIAKMLADEKEGPAHFQHNLQEGNQFNLYSAQSGANWIVALAFDPDATNLGLARQLTLQASSDLTDLLYQPGLTSGQHYEMLQMIDDTIQETINDSLENFFAEVLED